MGGGASRPDPGAHDRLLAEFSGSAAIDISDPFWAKMLRFPVPLTQLPPAEVEAATAHHCEELGARRAPRRSPPRRPPANCITSCSRAAQAAPCRLVDATHACTRS